MRASMSSPPTAPRANASRISSKPTASSGARSTRSVAWSTTARSRTASPSPRYCGSWRMSETREFLRSIDLPPGDLNELPDSAKRFPDGAQYRIEIPSTEGPRCLEAVLEEAARLDVTVHRVSQGSGVFMLTDEELDETARLAADA